MSNYILFLSEAAEEAVSTTVDSNTITDMAEAIDKFGVGTVLIAAMICYISVFITCILASNRKKSNDLTKMLKEQNENNEEIIIEKKGEEVFDKKIKLPCDYNVIAEFIYDDEQKDYVEQPVAITKELEFKRLVPSEFHIYKLGA